MPTKQPSKGVSLFTILGAIGALVTIVSGVVAIRDHMTQQGAHTEGIEGKGNQPVTGTKNVGQSAQVRGDVSQQANTGSGDQHNDSRREQDVVESPEQNGGSRNTQINGSSVGNLTINQSGDDKDPETVDGAREALGRMGLKFDEDGFADANNEPNLDAIKLYLRGGKSPNAPYESTFMLGLPLMRRSEQFPAILKLYQTQGREPLDFATKARGSPAFLKAMGAYTMADVLFHQLAYYQDGDAYATEMGRLLWSSGANPSSYIESLKNQKNEMQTFISNARNEPDAYTRDGIIRSATANLQKVNRQLAFLQSVIPSL